MRRYSVEELRSRKPETLTAMVNEHLPALLGGALAMGLSRADAEDVVQETFVAFFAKLDSFEGRSSLRTYLFGILYHKASDARRMIARQAPVEDIDALEASLFDHGGGWVRPPRGPEAEVLNGEMGACIERCAEGLSLKQRAAFFLKEVEGETSDAICDALGITPVNLRVTLFRARMKLRHCLERRLECVGQAALRLGCNDSPIARTQG